MELKEIALEVARELSEEGFSGTGTDYTLAFYPRFLAAVDAERGKDAVGYDEIFNAIAEAASPCGEGIGVSVKAFKRAIGGEIFLSPTIPPGFALVPLEPTEAMIASANAHDWYSDADPTWADLYRAMIQAAQEGVTK